MWILRIHKEESRQDLLGLLYRNTTEFILSQFWKLQIPDQGVGRAALPLKPGEEPFLASSSFWEPQAFLGLCQQNSGLWLCLYMAVFPPTLSSLFSGQPVTGLGPTLMTSS